MILSVDNIDIPASGKYDEVICDVQNPWKSQKWTWLKFMNDDYYEWCCEFRGDYGGHGISEKDNIIYVLTSDFLYLLNIDDGSIVSYIARPEFRKLVVSPSGDCIVANDYHLSLIDSHGIEMKTIETPMPLDSISFTEWQEHYLIVDALEFLNWDNFVSLKFDSRSLEIEIISQTNPGIR